MVDKREKWVLSSLSLWSAPSQLLIIKLVTTCATLPIDYRPLAFAMPACDIATSITGSQYCMYFFTNLSRNLIRCNSSVSPKYFLDITSKISPKSSCSVLKIFEEFCSIYLQEFNPDFFEG